MVIVHIRSGGGVIRIALSISRHIDNTLLERTIIGILWSARSNILNNATLDYITIDSSCLGQYMLISLCGSFCRCTVEVIVVNGGIGQTGIF